MSTMQEEIEGEPQGPPVTVALALIAWLVACLWAAAIVAVAVVAGRVST